MSDVRVSPDGTRVAFMDHQTRYDNRGWVKLVEPDGKVRTIGGEFWGEEGIAWSRDGHQVHVGAVSGEPASHIAMPSVGSLVLYDISAEQWLLDRTDDQLGIRALVPGAAAEVVQRSRGSTWVLARPTIRPMTMGPQNRAGVEKG